MVVTEGKAIKFPQFYEKAAITVGKDDAIYKLDGPTLQALRIAADDFMPLTRNRPCEATQIAHRYRITRRGDVIFIDIEAAPEVCGFTGAVLDGGARYAISLDGRILRRVLDGEPEEPRSPELPDSPDGGTPVDASELGISPNADAILKDPSRWAVPPGMLDGGSAHPRAAPPPPPPSSAPDGGAPGTP